MVIVIVAYPPVSSGQLRPEPEYKTTHDNRQRGDAVLSGSIHKRRMASHYRFSQPSSVVTQVLRTALVLTAGSASSSPGNRRGCHPVGKLLEAGGSAPSLEILFAAISAVENADMATYNLP
jgi:hypothetical protein